MNESPRGPRPPDDMEDDFLRERMERWGSSRGAEPPFDPFYSRRPRKSKWAAGILSFLVPGTGQLYLGLMQRGTGIMLLFMLNLAAIVFFSVSPSANIPLIVLFSLLAPVIYFYNIFDALQQTDRVNGWYSSLNYGGGEPAVGAMPGAGGFSQLRPGGSFGYVLIGLGVLLFLIAGKPEWLEEVLEFLGSSFGALLLIGVGVYLFIKESMKK